MKNLFSLLLLVSLVCLAQGEQRIMTLDELADVYYDAETGDPTVADEIKKLHGTEVRIAGYMVPFNQLENLKEFMLMPSSNGCNFCEAPMKEEMIYIKQPGKKKYPFISEPIVVTGKLWVKGAGTPAPNSTYAQFLYCLQDTSITTLQAKDHALLTKVTPRTIIKQVCSLLRVRLLKQVSFVELSHEEFVVKRQALLTKYLGGDEGAKALKHFLQCLEVPDAENLISHVSTYLAHWNAAFSDATGETIYYKKGLDLSEAKNQHQIAIACYDLLFHQEIALHEKIHQGMPSIDEMLARVSLILGLRQSFSQFYSSIGLVEMKPLQTFVAPYNTEAFLSDSFQPLAEQLLVKQETFISELYKSPKYQPYTKAINSPPVSMQQILTPKLYTEASEDSAFTPPQVKGYPQRLGAYLTGMLLKLTPEQTQQIEADGIKWSPKEFIWVIKIKSEETIASVSKTLESYQKLKVSRKGNTLKVESL